MSILQKFLRFIVSYFVMKPKFLEDIYLLKTKEFPFVGKAPFVLNVILCYNYLVNFVLELMRF